MTRKDNFGGDDGYDINIVYTGATDHQGHATTIRANVPRPWLGQISTFVQSDQWPEYKTQAAFMRDAIFHRMHWAETSNRVITPTLTRLLKQSKLESRLAQEMEEVSSYESLRDNIDLAIQAMIRAGNAQGARRLLDDFEEEIDTHEEPYRSKLLDQLRSLQKRVANSW